MVAFRHVPSLDGNVDAGNVGDLPQSHDRPPTLFSLIGLFRASWTIPALAVYRLIRDKEKMLATALLVAFGIAATPAFLVTDMNRSICYSFMTFLISLQLLRNHRELLPNKYLAAILIVNILIAPPSRTILRFLT